MENTPTGYTLEELKVLITLLTKRSQIEEGFNDAKDIKRYEIMYLYLLSKQIELRKEELQTVDEEG